MKGNIMAADSAGNDLSAVGVPITGFAAICMEVNEGNVLSDAEMAAGTIDLTAKTAYKYLGLFKDDGGLEAASEADDALEFFQEGYALNGLRTDTVKLGLAEDNPTVRRLIDGKDPNEQGVVYVDSAASNDTFLLLSMTRFKNGTEERRHGVARISAVEVDQEERGSVRAKAVTFQWVPSPLFNGSPYKKWFGTPSKG